jgi:hypothetical protein
MLKIAKVEILNDIEKWSSICKQAKVLTKNIEVQKEAIDKEADFQVVATINPEKFIYIHTTIMAGVKTEKNGFWITGETEKYINDNHDAWDCNDLIKDYKTFKRATTFVEHDQRLENAKGKCVDVIARDMGDTLLIDVLFSVDKRHNDLVANIENGIINAVSMGCSTAQTICSICGNKADDPETYCEHLKSGNKGRMYLVDGKSRKSAELCKENTFFDVSLVANPAFAGAVFRKILSSTEISNHLLANILNSKIETMYKNEDLFLKAASKDIDIANISFKSNGIIEIKTVDNIFTADEKLSKEEIEKISTFLPQKKEIQKSVLEKVLSKIFGLKEATHPIKNETGEKDFSITYDNYSDIPSRDRHNILDDSNLDIPSLSLQFPIITLEIKQNPSDEINSRVDEFECLKCGFQSELWKVKAASIDAGQIDVIECPRCFYVAEEKIFKSAGKHKFKIKEKVKIISKDHKNDVGEIVSFRGPFCIVKLENGKVVWKREDDLENQVNKKSTIFIASQDIPVDNDQGTYWFDEQGNSVITKGEKVSFVSTVENGEYGLFITESGEDFFMPMSYVSSNIIRSN